VGVRPKPNEQPLPPGWDFSYSDKGRMFFIDHVNKQTSWIDPRNGKPSPTPNLDFESRIGPLPVNFIFKIFFI
jgi:E3 ubiquitin-protein ligase NEDD4